MKDVLPEEIGVWNRLETAARQIAGQRGYREIRPSLLEETEVFTRSVGEVTDIVSKEMFSLQAGETVLSLRPEGTAGMVRAYLQAGYAKSAPFQRLFHIGPMFRYERPQKGRERMFTQFDVEAIGSLDPRLDVEVIRLAVAFFEELGLVDLEVRVNSMGDGDDRDRWRDAVRQHLQPSLEAHCNLCRERFDRNLLRVLDCKRPACQELHGDVPGIAAFLSEENRAHFESVLANLEAVGCSAVVDPGIVRGLDYYTRTVFEVHAAALGARSAVCGGGRYDHLVRDLGGPDVGAVGCAIGFTGTRIALEELGLTTSLEAPVSEVFVVSAGEGMEDEALRVAETLRRGGIGTMFAPDGKGMKAQMKAASRGGHKLAVVIGADEVERGTAQIKVLATTEQREVKRDALVSEVRASLGAQATPGE